MSKFPELNRKEFEAFLLHFSMPGSLRFRNNKWVGLNREGKPFAVHVKHGSTRKYPPPLVEAVARDLKVSFKEFQEWYKD
ncbi:MAG: hypothetical protein HPY90_07590 [Syntrophothermus sp.]|uniref:hypothetical protein n=1 Tax=Syntrophothermus sp. TaxID=2736299 RepID=UPI00257BE9FC|nr:hypothetical protein [Syntrophothermus sp.]NSW83123.1 hypothetical protein [Syntrophothermus sp.]